MLLHILSFHRQRKFRDLSLQRNPQRTSTMCQAIFKVFVKCELNNGKVHIEPPSPEDITPCHDHTHCTEDQIIPSSYKKKKGPCIWCTDPDEYHHFTEKRWLVLKTKFPEGYFGGEHGQQPSLQNPSTTKRSSSQDKSVHYSSPPPRLFGGRFSPFSSRDAGAAPSSSAGDVPETARRGSRESSHDREHGSLISNLSRRSSHSSAGGIEGGRVHQPSPSPHHSSLGGRSPASSGGDHKVLRTHQGQLLGQEDPVTTLPGMTAGLQITSGPLRSKLDTTAPAGGMTRARSPPPQLATGRKWTLKDEQLLLHLLIHEAMKSPDIQRECFPNRTVDAIRKKKLQSHRQAREGRYSL